VEAAGLVVLRSPSLLALVDPAHGGEVLELTDLRSGAGLLGRVPFAALPPTVSAIAEPDWVASYRGGWQIAAPNAGAASAGHPVHGAASTEPWAIEELGERSIRLRWEGFGLVAVRTLTLDDDAVEAAVEWRSAGPEPAPVVIAEHLTVGLAVLDPEVRLSLPGGRALELPDEQPRDLAEALPWPDAALLDGGRERADGWVLAETGSRYLVVADLPAGRLEALNPRSGIGLVLEWDIAALPYLWLWREARASGGHWRERTEILGLEPTSVPHGAGIAEAILGGHAVWPTVERPFCHRLRVSPLR
jgi:hypothetical protein